jgi:PhnB protein
MNETQTKQLVEPYLFFNGRCEEALNFYRDALNAEVTALMRFGDSPEQCMPEMPKDKVMHACLRIGETTVMASDGCSAEKANFQGFALSISAPDEQTATRFFNALSEGGQVQMPLGKTFYSPCFGMVTDRFGVMWMVIVVQEEVALARS